MSHGYGRYVRLGTEKRADAWFGVHYRLWANRRETPLWLEGTSYHREVLRRTGLGAEGGDSIPIYLPTGVEYSAVLNAVVARLQEVAEKVSEVLGADES